MVHLFYRGRYRSMFRSAVTGRQEAQGWLGRSRSELPELDDGGLIVQAVAGVFPALGGWQTISIALCWSDRGYDPCLCWITEATSRRYFDETGCQYRSLELALVPKSEHALFF